jgi:hypothetical protein
MKRSIGAALAFLLVPGALLAQGTSVPANGEVNSNISNTPYGGRTAQFLTLPADARGAALGGSYAAMATGAAALFWNPAGMALADQKEATLSYETYVADTRHVWAGVSMPLRGGEWALGVSLNSFGFSNQPVYTEDQQDGTGDTYSVAETAIGASLGMQLSDKFSVGFTGKLINDQLGLVSARGFAVDFGTNYHTKLGGKPIRASFTVLDYGSSLTHQGSALNVNVPPQDGGQGVENQPATLRTTGADLPTQFHVGLAYDLASAQSHRLTISSEFWQPSDSDPGFGFAGEYAVNVSGVQAALRGSYSYMRDNSGTSAEVSSGFQSATNISMRSSTWDGLALGGGLATKLLGFNLGVDYAYRNLGVLPSTNMFSVRFGW